MIRIALVEDQTLVRQGLRSMLALAPDMEVVAELEDGQQALGLIPSLGADVMLLDYRMPQVDGLSVLKLLAEQQALPPTLILTTFADDELLLDSAQAGAKGFLLKDVSLEVLLEAIRVVARGGRWFQPVTTEPLQACTEPFFPESDPFDQVTLTQKEQEVLRLMAGGYSNREIADLITTTEGTIKSYVSKILLKMGVRDRTRAVLKALNGRLI